MDFHLPCEFHVAGSGKGEIKPLGVFQYDSKRNILGSTSSVGIDRFFVETAGPDRLCARWGEKVASTSALGISDP